jgi:hypothetical protein
VPKRKKPFAAFNPAGEKRPVSTHEPSVRKTPVAAATSSPNTETPAWRIAQMEYSDPFGWHVVGGAKLREIREKIVHFERKTWNDILVREKHWNHAVATTSLSKAARDRLKHLNLDDLEELVSLRLTGPERVWGYRIGFVLHVLWWDPDHQVCPSPLKHT